MIVPNQPEAYSFRYLPRSRSKAIGLFFPGANVAFRRSALDPIRFFDTELNSGEDTDAGIRLVERGQFFSNPNAEVVHTAHLSFRKLMQQWFRIALYTVRVVRKHADGGLEVFLCFGRHLTGEARFRNLYYRPLPKPYTAIVFLSPFLLMNLALWAVVLSHGAPVEWMAATVAAALYFNGDRKTRGVPWRRRFLFAGLRLVINTILLYVSLLEGLRHGLLYVNYELD